MELRKTTFGVMVGALLLAGMGSAAQKREGLEGYELVWSDEFDKPNGSQPDTAKWVYDVGARVWGNHELEYYTRRSENVRIEDGKLVITARRESYVGAGGARFNFTSARLKTQGHFSQAYGRFEARIKLPAGQGIWPAFWALGENVDSAGWPKCGEIDIMENVGKEPGMNHGSLHGPGGKGTTSDMTATITLPAGHRLADDFHIYAVDWEPGAIRFYLDDHLYATFYAAQWPTDGTWVFNHRFFLILNVAVGGDWPGAPDDTTSFPQSMLVDYVRVYKRKN